MARRFFIDSTITQKTAFHRKNLFQSETNISTVDAGIRKPYPIQSRLKSDGVDLGIKKIYYTLGNMKKKDKKLLVSRESLEQLCATL
jgi:hypothetical protein